jgi:hypothetical protein
MPSEKIERTIRGRQGDELFEQVKAKLEVYASKYSLQKKVDANRRHISVKRTGMSADVQVNGDKVTCLLSYSPLLPAPIRQQVTKGVTWALEEMMPPEERRMKMAIEKIERTLHGKQGDELFKAIEKTLNPYVKKYSLKEQVDPEHKHISVKRTGMSGELQLEGDKVTCELDYSPLIPAPVRHQITKGVQSALDRIAGTA